jgi:hypothetical protein
MVAVSARYIANIQINKSLITLTTPTRARSPSILALIPSTHFRPGSNNRFIPLAGLADYL